MRIGDMNSTSIKFFIVCLQEQREENYELLKQA